MKPMRVSLLTLLLLLIGCQLLVAQTDMSLGVQKLTAADTLPADATPEQMLALQRRLMPQEKVYMMTDTELYMPGDTVWLRVWVQDGVTLRDSQLGSQYVFVGLYSARDLPIDVVKFKMREGKFWGYITLPKSLISGHYTLAAYTHYQHKLPADFICRKQIHVITREHLRRGFTVRPLYEHQLPPAEPLASTSVIANRSFNTSQKREVLRSDTMQHVNFQAPANTWLAITVTDDALAPVDVEASIVNRLPQVPDYFTVKQFRDSAVFYISTTYVETKGIIAGKVASVKKLKSKDYEGLTITAFNFATQKIYFAEPDEKGEFYINDADVPEGSVIGYAVYNKEGKHCYRVDPYEVLYRNQLEHIETGRDHYFVDRNRERLKEHGIDPKAAGAPDQLLQLMAKDNDTVTVHQIDETVITLGKKDRRGKELKQLVNETIYVDDIYTRNATRTFMCYKMPFERVVDLISVFEKEGLRQIGNSGLKYVNDKNKIVPVRIVVGTKEWPLTYNADGTLAINDALKLPTEMLYAVDYIAPEVARSIAPSLMYPDSPILHLDPLSVREATVQGNYKTICAWPVVGYQKPAYHLNNVVRPRMVHTRYWNPAVCTGRDGQISIDLPLPIEHHTTYTLRAEGVTPDGELVSIMRRITM